MHSTDATLPSAGPERVTPLHLRVLLSIATFWIPVLLLMLVVVVPDFEARHAQSAGGVEVESDLIATMATENSLREKFFLLVMLSFGGGGILLGLLVAGQPNSRGSSHIWLIGATLAYAWLSLGWSDLPSWTFRRMVISTLFVMGAWGIGRVWRPMQLVHATLILSAIFAIVGILAEIHYGTFMVAGGYRFSGMLHPNRQALSCGLFVLAAVAMQRHTGNPLYWLFAAVAGGLLVLTGSRGGLVACVMGVVLQLVIATPPSRRIVWPTLAALLVTAALVFLAVEPNGGRRLESIAKMGRSDALADPQSLTGRIPIWNEMIAGIKEKPLFGYGFAAFWTPERIRRMSYIHDWEFNNSHSCYLEMILSLGAIGFSLGMLAILTIGFKGFQIMYVDANPGMAFILGVFLMAFVNGIIESIFVTVGYEYLVWLIGAFMIVYNRPPSLHSAVFRQAHHRQSQLGAPVA